MSQIGTFENAYWFVRCAPITCIRRAWAKSRTYKVRKMKCAWSAWLGFSDCLLDRSYCLQTHTILLTVRKIHWISCTSLSISTTQANMVGRVRIALLFVVSILCLSCRMSPLISLRNLISNNYEVGLSVCYYHQFLHWGFCQKEGNVYVYLFFLTYYYFFASLSIQLLSNKLYLPWELKNWKRSLIDCVAGRMWPISWSENKNSKI